MLAGRVAKDLLIGNMKFAGKAEYNYLSMRISGLLWIAPLAATFVISAPAQDANSLPSAPSATLERQAPPPPAPEQKQPELKKRDAKPSAPVLETLDPKPIPQPVSTTSAVSQGSQ